MDILGQGGRSTCQDALGDHDLDLGMTSERDHDPGAEGADVVDLACSELHEDGGAVGVEAQVGTNLLGRAQVFGSDPGNRAHDQRGAGAGGGQAAIELRRVLPGFDHVCEQRRAAECIVAGVRPPQAPSAPHRSQATAASEDGAESRIRVTAVEGHELGLVLVEEVFQTGRVEAVPFPVANGSVLVRAQVLGVETGADGQGCGRREGEDHHVVGLLQEPGDCHLSGEVTQTDTVARTEEGDGAGHGGSRQRMTPLRTVDSGWPEGLSSPI